MLSFLSARKCKNPFYGQIWGNLSSSFRLYLACVCFLYLGVSLYKLADQKFALFGKLASLLDFVHDLAKKAKLLNIL